MNEVKGIIKNINYKEDKIILYVDDLIINYYINSYNDAKYEVGDYIKITGNIKLPVNISNTNLFNYKNYLYSKNIHYVMNANKIEIIKKNNNVISMLKNVIFKRINKIDNNEYLFAFILGDSNYIDKYVKSTYSKNGISHLFAISGMHITLITSTLMLLISKLTNNKKITYLFIFIILFLYLFVTNFSPSITRAVLFFIFCTINKLSHLNINTKYILIYICSICLLYNPYYFYNTGFIFSYVISYFLINYSDLINKQKKYIFKILYTSIISFLFSVPIMINNYFNINLLSPLLNIIFVPFISFIIFPLSLLIFIIPNLSFILYIFIKMLEFLSMNISKINIFTITLCHISFFSCIIYYLLIVVIVNKFKENKYHYLIFLFIILLVHHNIRYLDSNTIISILNVGQGDTSLISLPNNKGNILIDSAGDISNNSDIGKDIIIPYLNSQGINRLDYLILTHGDYDHMGSSIYLVNNFKVEKVIFNCGTYNDLENELIKVLEKKRIKYYSCIKELTISNNKLYFLNTKIYDNENDNSNIIYTNLNNYKFLFMGDASTITEKEILDKYHLPNIDVLKVGHHGSRTSSSQEFIDTINPKYSLISVGKNNRYGHPNKEVLENLEDSIVYRTDRDGSIMFKIKKNKLKIEICPS